MTYEYDRIKNREWSKISRIPHNIYHLPLNAGSGLKASGAINDIEHCP